MTKYKKSMEQFSKMDTKVFFFQLHATQIKTYVIWDF